MNLMEYKGYLGTVEYSGDDHCLYGKLAFIRSLVNYEASEVAGLEAAFKAAVDDYLAACERAGKAPEVPLKGSFNVRVGPNRHRAAVLAAAAENKTLNQWIGEAIDRAQGLR